MVDHHNGLLCRIKDADDLAEKMKKLVSFDDAALEAFGRNGRLKMQAEYDESFVINKYLQALRKIKKAS